MKFQRFMTGRGNRGYGFKAATAVHPQTPYMTAVRESDTGATEIPVLEILTAQYGELGAVASFHGQEGRASGYMDILFPAAKDEDDEEWAKILDNPGRLLYLPHVDHKTFLRTSDLGNNVRIEDDSKLAQDEPIPEPTHSYSFTLDDDTLADLVADLWYASSIRLNNPGNPESWPVVHLQLTEEADQVKLMDMGREFYCNKLMPAFPQALRRVISVCIGAKYSDAVSAMNGGAAALVIPQYDPDQTEMIPGRYYLTETVRQHQSINPLGNDTLWRAFGHAVLRYARMGTPAAIDSTDSWLNDFFVISKEFENQPISANWIYAFMLFNGHSQANAAAAHTDVFSSGEPERITETFESDVWMAADPGMLTGLGLEEAKARENLIWLENDAVKALNENTDIQISQSKYSELFRRAFTLPIEKENDTLVSGIAKAYDKVLTRDRDRMSGESVSWLLNELPKGDADSGLVSGQEERLCGIVNEALSSSSFKPTDEHLRILTGYARTGENQAKAVTEYGERLISFGIDLQRLAGFRTVQFGNWLDNSFMNQINHQIGDVFRDQSEKPFRTSIKNYIQAVPSSGAQKPEELLDVLKQMMAKYVDEHADSLRLNLGEVKQAFADFGAENSEEAISSLCSCMDIANIPFSPEDQVIIQPILYQDTPLSRTLVDNLTDRFSEALPSMFEHAIEEQEASGHEGPVIEAQWISCLKPNGSSESGTQMYMREKLANSLNKHVSYDYSALRPHLRYVLQAFKDIKMERSKEAMGAICECMQESDVHFDTKDAAIVKLVLTNDQDPEAAVKMNKILEDLFEEELEEIVKGENHSEDAFIQCFSDKNPTEFQIHLKQALLKKLKAYAEKNATELTSQVDRVMVLYERFEQNNSGTTDRVESFCNILETRAREQDEGEMLTQKDLDILKGRTFRNIDESSQERLIETLQILFKKDLPRMVEKEEARKTWQECLREKNDIGTALRKKAVSSVQEYIGQNADEMYGSPMQVIEVCDAFDANPGEKLEVWETLLQAKLKNEKGNPILTNDYNETLTSVIQKAKPEADFAERMADVFASDLPLIAEGLSSQEWARLRENTFNYTLGVAFDSKAQSHYSEYVSNLTEQCKKGNTIDCLGNLLDLVHNLIWNKSDSVRDVTVQYLSNLKRDFISPEEMNNLMEFKRVTQHDMSDALNVIFKNNVPELLRHVSDTDLVAWNLAVDKGIDLKKTFKDEVQAIVKEPEKNGLTKEQLFRSVLIAGEKLSMQAIAVPAAADLIEQRKGKADERLMTPDERDLLEQTTLSANDLNVWKKYLSLLDWEPSDPENEERDSQLKADAAALRQTAFTAISQEQAKEIKGYPVWKEQLIGLIHQRMNRLSQDSNDYEALCKIPERWNDENEELPFLQFTDLLSYDESSSLEHTCEEKAKSVVQNTSLNTLKQTGLYDKSTWFGKLLERVVSTRVAEDSKTLAAQCNTPEEVCDLQTLIKETGSQEKAKTVNDALTFVAEGRNQDRIAVVARNMLNQSEETRDITASLLQKAIFGENNGTWQEQWGLSGEGARIGMAGLSYLTRQEPDWNGYLDTVFDQCDFSGKGLKNGNHPAQRLLFAADILNRCGMKEYADQLPDMISNNRSDIYRKLRGAGLKIKALRPLKDLQTDEKNPAYELLFRK